MDKKKKSKIICMDQSKLNNQDKFYKSKKVQYLR